MAKPNKDSFGTKRRFDNENKAVSNFSSGAETITENRRENTLSSHGLDTRRESVLSYQAVHAAQTNVLNQSKRETESNPDSYYEKYDDVKDFIEKTYPGKSDNKNDTTGRRSRVRNTSSYLSHKAMAKYLDEHNEYSKSSGEFIHYDETDRKGQFIHDRSVYGHDKLAQSEIKDIVAGGAVTTFLFDKNGKLNADVKLNSYFKRNDRKGFIHRSTDFIDSSRKIIDDFSAEENEAAASNIDSKAEIFLSHRVEKHKENAKRYKEISKFNKRQEKQLKKDIRKERKNTLRNVAGNKSPRHTKRFIEENNYDTSSPFIESKEDKFVSQNFFDKNELTINEIRRQEANAAILKTDKDWTVYSKSSEIVAVRNHYQMQSNNVPALEKNSKNKKDSVSDRFMTKEETQTQVFEKRKATNKKKNKEVRRAAAVASLSKAIDAKRVLQNEIGDFSGNVTGDAITDGSKGLLSVATVGIKNALKNFAITFGKAVVSTLASMVIRFAPVLVLILILCGGFFVITSSATGILGSLGGGDSGLEMELDVYGDGTMYAHASLPQETIDDYISQLYEIYGDDMTADRETLLRYALSKVGCAYNQDYHGSLTVDIFDCSSLAYRSYREIGVDISKGGGWYSAAAECQAMEESGRGVSAGGLLPGDLLFYKGDDPTRYKQIGHVAIYLGRIKINGSYVDKSVEALGKKWGVVVSDTRGNTVSVCRPLR